MKSIWGEGEKETIEIIRKENMGGVWLDLAGGDGRYLDEILPKAEKLIISDVSIIDLEKIKKQLIENQKKKVEIKSFDMTKKFPFEDEFFDGIFCTGTLHLFPEEKLNLIFSEINRVLKSNGKLIIDFVFEIKRIFSSNKKISPEEKKKYFTWKKEDVEKVLKKHLSNYQIKQVESIFTDDVTSINKYNFKTEGKFFLITAQKLKF